jgi:hypothetical protein
LCWRGIDGLTIFDIPRLGTAKTDRLQSSGVIHLEDIPLENELTTKQQAFVDFIVEEQVTIDKPAIKAALDELTYPLYFFDFETIDYALPVFDGCTPYQQVPFQYSCHILHESGELTHDAFVHTGENDPRPALLDALLNCIGERGSVIVYYAPFERARLRELAAAFPQYTERLDDIADRLWDQLDIFKQHYRHYGFGKSNSLKSVLPVVVPELSYAVLDVQNGTQAQVVWEKMVLEGESAEKERLIRQLLAYCELDTLAMVKMHTILTTL